MKKIISIIIALIVITFSLMFIFLPKVQFSANENRYLKKFPNLSVKHVLDTTYMSDINDYIADHFPFREELLNIKTKIFKLIGITKQDDVYFGQKGYLLQEYKKPKESEKIVKVVNRFIDKFPNANIDFMLIPTSIYINSDLLPENSITNNENDTIKYFKNNLHSNFIDVTESLLKEKDKYLYYRTDHHWTTEGAYVAYQQYCDVKNIVCNNYEFEEVSDYFYGTLYSKVLDDSLDRDIVKRVVDNNKYKVYYNETKETKDTMYNDAYLREKDKYSYFLDNNQDLIIITNENAQNKEKLLVIKDSFANTFIPLIASHYQEIHVIDPRYYQDSIIEYIDDNNLNNILFLYNVLTIDDDIGILSINK